MTLLHWRQQKQMSAVKESQEWGVNNVAMTEKKIESAEVCKESTSSDDKDDNVAAATWAHFVKVTDTLDEVMCFSQPQALSWEWLWSQCQYHTQKTHMKLTEVMIEIWLW